MLDKCKPVHLCMLHTLTYTRGNGNGTGVMLSEIQDEMAHHRPGFVDLAVSFEEVPKSGCDQLQVLMRAYLFSPRLKLAISG